MAQVVTVADPRVVAEQGVVLNDYVGPLNWEHYKIPASGLSNTQITFANLVTLGTNRIYNSGFQIEYTIEITIPWQKKGDLRDVPVPQGVTAVESAVHFVPFPLSSVTDQIRCNINGAACMSRPQESLFQRMMFWRQQVLDETCNFCPHTKLATILDSTYEYSGRDYQEARNYDHTYSRFGASKSGTGIPCISSNWDASRSIFTITFREPVLCPPFNQRLDKMYQSPLFNITSIDIVYQLNDLRRMLENYKNTLFDAQPGEPTKAGAVLSPNSFNNFSIRDTTFNITSAQLCFDVASLPPGMTVPPVLQVPYYDNVCYVTRGQVNEDPSSTWMTSGVYTLAQVPTAIYVFVSENQLFRSTCADSTIQYNPSLPPIKNINITMGNNTQILTTTTPYDRYVMSKVNGLEDVKWLEWINPSVPLPANEILEDAGGVGEPVPRYSRCILKLIPGIDLLIPDKRLVGGSDAEQMVFQVRLEADCSAIPQENLDKLCLWVMFEYVGTLTIEPVHASIDMLPIKVIPPIGSISAPDVVADSSVSNLGGGGEGTTPRGAGIFSFLRNIPGLVSKGIGIARTIYNSELGRRVRKTIDNVLGEPRAPPDPDMWFPPAAPAPKGGRIIGAGSFYE